MIRYITFLCCVVLFLSCMITPDPVENFSVFYILLCLLQTLSIYVGVPV